MGPRLIFWEITQKCNLNCPYCRRESYSSSLSLEESFQIVDSITKDYLPLLIFSGGEPLLHPDFFSIAAYARNKGLTCALATNATLLDESLAQKIKSLDFHRVAVSLDGASKEINDALRTEGSFLKVLRGIQFLRVQGIALQINTTVTRRNVKEIPAIHNLCLDLGIKAWHIFAFVPVGCGVSIPKEERLSAEEYENFLNEMADLSLRSKIEIKLTCAPHYQRILFERKINFASLLNRGCLAGSGVCFISAQGEVYPCGYLPLRAGNILKENFKTIWEDSYLFKTLRSSEYLKGKCKACEYVDLCWGCRARAYASTGDYLSEEPECIYQPLTAKS